MKTLQPRIGIAECKAESLNCINCLNLKSTSKFEDIRVDYATRGHNSCHGHILAINKLKSDLFGVSI